MPPSSKSNAQVEADIVVVCPILSTSSWYINVSVHMLNCSLVIDSGAATTIINSKLYYDLPLPRPRLKETKMRFRLTDDRVMLPLGVMTCEIKVGDHVVEA